MSEEYIREKSKELKELINNKFKIWREPHLTYPVDSLPHIEISHKILNVTLIIEHSFGNSFFFDLRCYQTSISHIEIGTFNFNMIESIIKTVEDYIKIQYIINDYQENIEQKIKENNRILKIEKVNEE